MARRFQNPGSDAEAEGLDVGRAWDWCGRLRLCICRAWWLVFSRCGLQWEERSRGGGEALLDGLLGG